MDVKFDKFEARLDSKPDADSYVRAHTNALVFGGLDASIGPIT